VLIFVKRKLALFLMPKCASTALEESFGTYSEFVIGGSPRLKHLPLNVYERHIGRLLARRLGKTEVFEKLCLFREPLDWLFSWYRYRMRTKLTGSDRHTLDISFAQFLNEHFSASPARHAHILPQSTYVESTEGRYDAMTLYRYEDIMILVAELERRLQARVAWTRVNASPAAAFDLTQREVSEVREKLRAEYAIYESIPVRQNCPAESPSGRN
jgi:hypothetical protein